MIHFLIFNYGNEWVEVVNAPHLGNAEGIEKAKQIVEEVVFAEAESAKAEEAAKNTDEAAKVAPDYANVKAEEEKRAALQKKAEVGSLVAKNPALYELAQLDKEVGLCQPPQIDCSVLVVLIGRFMNHLKSSNIIMQNIIR